MDAVSELTGEVAAISAHMFRVRFPFITELRTYSWARFRADLLAGATLTLVSVPQAIGFSLILNLPPAPVIASVIIGGFVGSLFFSSRHHVFGPTSSISLITAATIIANAGLGLPPLQLALTLGMMIGCIQLLAGLLNFGEITKFISRSVIVAYSTGIGLLLIATQLHNLLGINGSRSFMASLWEAAADLGTIRINLWDLGIGAATLGLFALVRRLRPAWPEALIGLGIMGLLSSLAGLIFKGALPFRLIRNEGALTAVIPAFGGFHVGAGALHLLPELAGTAIAISILGMLEAAAITKALAARSGQRIEPNQELIGMGVANIACSLFGAVPGSSSFARSAVNYQSGAQSQLSSMMSSVIVLGVLGFVTPVFNAIPVAALAAHLIRVGVRMINGHQVRIALRSTRADGIVFVITLASCLLLRLDTAIYVGIGVALALFLQTTATPTLVEYGINASGNLAELADPSQRPMSQVSIIHVEGELFFGAADLFQEQVRRLAEDPALKVFILRMKNARHLDASTVMALEALHDYLTQTGRHLLISGCNPEVIEVFRRSRLLSKIGEDNIFPAQANPTASTRLALKRAQLLLPGLQGDVRVFYDRKHVPAPVGESQAPSGASGPDPQATPSAPAPAPASTPPTPSAPTPPPP